MPGDGADLTAISQAEAVRLFAERAAAVKPEFAVTAENAAPVAAAVRRLDGIALAIELAAARMTAMTPSKLARRLQRSFAVLAAGRRGTLPPSPNAWATIDWSYQLLAAPEQWLLARLAVFAGGCSEVSRCSAAGRRGNAAPSPNTSGPPSTGPTSCSPRPNSGCWPGWQCSPAAAPWRPPRPSAARKVIDPDTVFELLASLVARSLVVTEEHRAETRYRLLETIRQYGEERLTENGETDRWKARHADYYVGFLQQIRHHDRRAGDVSGGPARRRTRQLLAAWSWAVRHPQY